MKYPAELERLIEELEMRSQSESLEDDILKRSLAAIKFLKIYHEDYLNQVFLKIKEILEV